MLRVRPEGEVCQLLPGRVVASDVQGSDSQWRVLSHWASCHHRNAIHGSVAQLLMVLCD